MKMIRSTSRTSMSGVMLMSAFCPPEVPTAIAIVNFSCFLLSPLAVEGRCLRPRGLRILRDQLGDQADLIDAGRPQIVDDLHHALILGARIALDVASLVQPVGQQ